jgi:hypothetical protein
MGGYRPTCRLATVLPYRTSITDPPQLRKSIRRPLTPPLPQSNFHFSFCDRVQQRITMHYTTNSTHFALQHRATPRSNSSCIHPLGVFSLIPLEIRTLIWKDLLIDCKHIKISYTATPSPIPDSEGKPQLQKFKARLPTASILRLSKAIHAEVEEIVYRYNVFEFDNRANATSDLLVFLQAISLQAYRTIQFIILHLNPSIGAVEYKPALDFLAGCTGLKRLETYGLTSSKIPKTMQLCFGGLRLEEINFVDTAQHLVAGLKGLVEGKGKPWSKMERKRATEGRISKVIYLYS